MAKETTEQAEDRKPTDRVVLSQVRVIVLPEAITPEQQEAISVALHTGRGKPVTVPVVEAWMEVGEHAGASKLSAIEAHAGVAGTPDAKPGTYRAPTVTAWKGAIRYSAPPQPLVERELLP